MEVIKDLKSSVKTQQPAQQAAQAKSDASSAKQVSSKNLSAGSATIQSSSGDSVRVQLSDSRGSGGRQSVESAERRVKLSKAESTVSDSSARVAEVADIFRSISGIANQALNNAQSGDKGGQRTELLQNEAQALLKEAESRVADAPSGANPLRGEAIEVSLGDEQLRVDPAPESEKIAGLAGVDFTTVKAIEDTLNKVEAAKEGIEQLAQKLGDAGERIRELSSNVDVEAANGESALSRVDDVEAAARLADNIASRLETDESGKREAAFASKLSSESLRLLEE